jgi:hypothetical protein
MSVALGLPPHLQHRYDDAEEPAPHFHVRLEPVGGEAIIFDRRPEVLAERVADLIASLERIPADELRIIVGADCWRRRCI